MRPAALLLLLGGCAGGDASCPVTLANASAQPVEQFYIARPGAGAWGPDLVAAGELAPGGSLPLRFPGAGDFDVRAVWANGRAAEMRGLGGCRVARITVLDGALRAE